MLVEASLVLKSGSAAMDAPDVNRRVQVDAVDPRLSKLQVVNVAWLVTGSPGERDLLDVLLEIGSL